MTTYLITGSNRGIGLELCRQLVGRGENVIATCRSASEELKQLGVRVEEGIDITSEESINKLVYKLGDLKIDCLINNAGILEKNTLNSFDRMSLIRQFEVNAVAPIIFSRALMSNFINGSKIIFISSRMASIEDNTSGGSYGYRMSKVALNIASRSLSIDLYTKGIIVTLLHPGLVSTRMTNFTKHGIEVNESVSRLLKIIESLKLSESGCFYHSEGFKLPW